MYSLDLEIQFNNRYIEDFEFDFKYCRNKGDRNKDGNQGVKEEIVLG